MNRIINIKFSEHGKVHEFDSGHFVLKKGDRVLVETDQGPTLGIVCADPKSRSNNMPKRPLRKIFRLANDKDIEKFDKKCQLEREVYAFCYRKIKERSLPMCLVSVERLFDGSHSRSWRQTHFRGQPLGRAGLAHG